MALPKLSIAELEPSGINGLLIYCVPCGHLGELDLETAKARWGSETSLDDIKAVCSKCASREIDVRPRWPDVGPGGLKTMGG